MGDEEGHDSAEEDLGSLEGGDGAPAPELARDAAGFEALLDYLNRSRGFDFGSYKRATLSRRIHRRMQTVGVTDYAEYIDALEVRPDEFPQKPCATGGTISCRMHPSPASTS